MSRDRVRVEVVSLRGIAPEELSFDAWDALWVGYLEFYKTSLPEATRRETFARLTERTTDKDAIHGLLARDPTTCEPLGIAHYLFHKSTWHTDTVCYLNDLFTKAGVRGRGVGRALIDGVRSACDVVNEEGEHKVRRLYWSTQQMNQTARKLYDTYAYPEFIQYRINLP
ncbi:hypothetical protein PYCC9005_005964 [Savitreella phatthalungensis]